MTPEIIKFEFEHLAKLQDRDGPSEYLSEAIEYMKSYPGLAFSGKANGKLIGSAGVVMLPHRVGYAWVIVTPEIESYKLWFHRAIKSYLKRIIAEYRLTRLYSEALKCSRRNREWIEALGFKVKPYVVYEMEIK